MREIKFRAWSKTGKRMIGWEEMTANHAKVYTYFLWSDMYKLMQFTDIEDKNGREICEFDFIKFKKEYEAELPSDAIFKVVYDDGAFCGANTDYAEYLGILVDVGTVEVIGNVYENPEMRGVV